MATIMVERDLNCSVDQAWALLEDTASVDKAFPGVVQDSRLDSDGVRTVTFANGTVVREAIVSVDPARRRVAYSIQGGRFSVHGASMQIVCDAGDAGARLVWISDFLPDSVAPVVEGLMERGGHAFSAAVSLTAAH